MGTRGGAWPAWLVKHLTLRLSVVGLSPTLVMKMEQEA